MRNLIALLAILLIIFAIGQKSNLFPNLNINKYVPTPSVSSGSKEVVYEESVVTKVVDSTLPSVVTIGIVRSTASQDNNPWPLGVRSPYIPLP